MVVSIVVNKFCFLVVVLGAIWYNRRIITHITYKYMKKMINSSFWPIFIRCVARICAIIYIFVTYDDVENAIQGTL